MIPTSVTSKGQILIPKAVRDEVGIKPGARALVSAVGGKVVIDLVPTLEKIRGYFRGIKALSKKEQKKIVQEAVVEKFHRKGFT